MATDWPSSTHLQGSDRQFGRSVGCYGERREGLHYDVFATKIPGDANFGNKIPMVYVGES